MCYCRVLFSQMVTDNMTTGFICEHHYSNMLNPKFKINYTKTVPSVILEISNIKQNHSCHQIRALSTQPVLIRVIRKRLQYSPRNQLFILNSRFAAQFILYISFPYCGSTFRKSIIFRKTNENNFP